VDRATLAVAGLFFALTAVGLWYMLVRPVVLLLLLGSGIAGKFSPHPWAIALLRGPRGLCRSERYRKSVLMQPLTKLWSRSPR
jgi:hypothetical protein